jgi:hypothetical protein
MNHHNNGGVSGTVCLDACVDACIEKYVNKCNIYVKTWVHACNSDSNSDSTDMQQRTSLLPIAVTSPRTARNDQQGDAHGCIQFQHGNYEESNKGQNNELQGNARQEGVPIPQLALHFLDVDGGRHSKDQEKEEDGRRDFGEQRHGVRDYASVAVVNGAQRIDKIG